MRQPIPDKPLNKVLLKPRFRKKMAIGKAELLLKIKEALKKENHPYRTKLVGNHLVIDVPKLEETFWSPQLHAEVIEEHNRTIVKGIFGPKPQVWTFFMFIHFAVAVAFVVFLVMAYTQYSLKQDYKFAMIMCFAMPVIWILLYVGGQIGKKKSHKQLVELDSFFRKL
ncbi:MAG: GTP-binding protein, partial [Flavobacteriales bacterium]